MFVLLFVQMLMSAPKRQNVNVHNVSAKTHGVVMIAHAPVAFSTFMSMTHASVSLVPPPLPPPLIPCFQATLVIWVIHSTWRLCPYPSSYMVCAAGKKISSSKLGWFVSLIVLVGMVSLGVIGYIIYKYRLRVQFFYSAISPAYFFPCILYSSGFVFWICLKCTELWCCCFHCCWVGNGSHTWIPRSGQSWHNTCHWIARMRFTTTCRRMLKLQVSDPSTPAQKGFYYACDENPVGGVSHLGLGHRKKHLVLFAISVCPWFQKSSQTTLVFCLGLMV